jgi:hypothetical protein
MPVTPYDFRGISDPRTEKEIAETNAIIHQLQSEVSRMADPERIDAHKLIWRLMQARTDAHRSLCALVEGVELRRVSGIKLRSVQVTCEWRY